AVRADDALIDALGGGDLDVARAVVADDDPLIAMLAAWAASARPDEPEPVPTRPSLTVVGAGDYVESEPGDPGEESVGSVAAAVPDGAPPVGAPALAQDAAPAVAARPGPGLAMVVPLGGAAAPATDLAGADPAPRTDAQMPVATDTPATEVPAAQSPAT